MEKKYFNLALFGILKEAFKTSLRNGRLFLFITFIMFSYYTVMGLAHIFVLIPRTKDLASNAKLLPKNGASLDADPVLFKAILKDLRFFLAYEFVVLSFLCVVLVFSVSAVVHSTFEAYTAKVLSLKDVVLGIRGRWKRALRTSIWMIVISSASLALLFFASGVVRIMAEGSVLTALNWGMVISGGFYAVYLCSLWTLALVVSVMEENLSGIKAISEANELMKGKKLKGFLLMVVMVLAGGAISMAFRLCFRQQKTGAAISDENEVKMGMLLVYLAVGVPKKLAICVLKVFAFVVYTLFYHECKMSKMEEENRALYAPIAAVAEF